jgi:hypothetical protein
MKCPAVNYLVAVLVLWIVPGTFAPNMCKTPSFPATCDPAVRFYSSIVRDFLSQNIDMQSARGKLQTENFDLKAENAQLKTTIAELRAANNGCVEAAGKSHYDIFI